MRMPPLRRLDALRHKIAAKLEEMPEFSGITIMLLGCGVRNPNRGVGALGTACVDNLSRAFPGARLILGDTGLATTAEIQIDGRTVDVETSWITFSERLLPRSGTKHLDLLRRLPGPVRRIVTNRTFEQMRCADVVMDICGGDSFADLYGLGGLLCQVAFKRLALDMGKPLVLLPQTLGPFASDTARRAAGDVIRRSSLVASRDAGGIEDVRHWLGPKELPMMRACPDVAWTLPPSRVEDDKLPSVVTAGDGPLIGLNVSGLLHARQPGLDLAVDYRELVSSIIQWSMSIPGARVLLVPHVFGAHRTEPAPDAESSRDSSDLEACRIVRDEWSRQAAERIGCIEEPLSSGELKYVIGKCDFFVGARMHACIAAASQAVPTAVLAYSKKAEGVFGMIGARSLVVDMRESSLEGLLHRVESLFREREEVRRTLRSQVTAAADAVRAFFVDTLTAVVADHTGVMR